MFYDDEARRFNFLSGLLLGAVLGTGLGLISAPQTRRKVKKKSRGYGSALRQAVEGGGTGPVAGMVPGRKRSRKARKGGRRVVL